MIARLDRYLGGHSHLRGLMAAHGLAGLLQGAALGLLVPFLRAFLSGERGALNQIGRASCRERV